MKYKREYKNQPIPDEWITEAIKEGHRTTDEIIKELGIHRNTVYTKMRKLIAEGKIKRDEKRVPFFYYVKEERPNEGYGSHKE